MDLINNDIIFEISKYLDLNSLLYLLSINNFFRTCQHIFYNKKYIKLSYRNYNKIDFIQNIRHVHL